jgi:heme/copper-type cytochrome/quinol oxidase subunit 2
VVTPTRQVRVGAVVGILVAVALLAGATPAVAQTKREFAVEAYKYGYRVAGSDKAEIRVHVGDVVHVTLSSSDIPHSFTIDDYRVMRRVEAGKTTTVEFVADKPGTFVIHCTLTADEKCKDMKATLVVEK